MENQEPQAPQDDTNILKEKPKRKQTLTDAQRAKKAEHMRQISLARIGKARLANESKLEEKEDKVIERLAKIEVKKEQVKKIKETMPPAPKTSTAKRVKKVVVQDSTDSEDYYDDNDESNSEDEVIYVTKKPTKKSQDKTIIKPKKETNTKEVVQETPKTVIKFL